MQTVGLHSVGRPQFLFHLYLSYSISRSQTTFPNIPKKQCPTHIQSIFQPISKHLNHPSHHLPLPSGSSYRLGEARWSRCKGEVFGRWSLARRGRHRVGCEWYSLLQRVGTQGLCHRRNVEEQTTFQIVLEQGCCWWETWRWDVHIFAICICVDINI